MFEIKKYLEKFKDILKVKNRKKAIENSLILIIIGVITVIAGQFFFENDTKTSEVKEIKSINTENITTFKTSKTDSSWDIEDRLKRILSKIEGAGEIDILITYSCSKELVHLNETKKTSNQTDEKDSGGGISNKKEESYENKVVYEDSEGGGKKPVIIKELEPAIKGVVVVSDGANDITVKERLSTAVQVLLNVPVHRVQIYQRKK